MQKIMDLRIKQYLEAQLHNESSHTICQIVKLVQCELERACGNTELSSSNKLSDEVLAKRIKAVCRIVRNRLKRKIREQNQREKN